MGVGTKILLVVGGEAEKGGLHAEGEDNEEEGDECVEVGKYAVFAESELRGVNRRERPRCEAADDGGQAVNGCLGGEFFERGHVVAANIGKDWEKFLLCLWNLIQAALRSAILFSISLSLVMKPIVILLLGLFAGTAFSQSLVGTYSWLGPRPAAPVFNPAFETPTELGSFTLSPNLTLYIPVDSFARARVFTASSSSSYDRRILTRAFDPSERLVHWQYQDLEQTQPLFHPQDGYALGLPPLPLNTGSGHSISSDAEFALAGAGIHQIRVTTRQLNMSCKVALSQDLPFGLSFQNGNFQRWSSCPDTLYFLIPPNAVELTIRVSSGNLTVIDELNAPTLLSGTTTIPISPSSVGTVWRLVASGPFNFRAWKMPLILCHDANTATQLEASVMTATDGTIYQHQIQEVLHKTMSTLLTPANVGVASNMIVTNYGPYQNDWLADPLRNKHLITGYQPTFSQPLFDRLAAQNVNAGSHWAGTWQANPTGRWDNYLSNPEIGGQLGGQTQQSYNIGVIATLNMPFNPYYQYQSELIHRATAACFLDLQKMQEAEHFPRYQNDPYSGHPAFTLGQRILPAYGIASPHMPDSIREIWTEAVRHLVDRHLCDYITTTRNQTAHFLTAFESFGQASRDSIYQTLSRRFARLFVSSQAPAGWYEEAYGPCGSYSGITDYLMAEYFRMTGDTMMRNSLARNYDFFNHGNAPEPNDRTLLGGFNYNHRIGQGFFGEQWAGATRLGRDIPEVGIWLKQTQAEISADSLTAITQITNALGNLSTQIPGMFSPRNYEHYMRTSDTSYIWPAYREPFTRNFADDMVAVKTSTYFANIFTGTPAGALWQLSSRELVREPRAFETDSTHVYVANVNKVAPLLGGGLSTFWTPDFGTSLMATNWAPDFHNGVVARVQNTTVERYWEDYLAATFTWDSVQKELHMMGEIEDQDIAYDREIVFRDCYLDCAVALMVNAPFNFVDMNEFIPLANGGKKQYDVHYDQYVDSLFPQRPRAVFTVCNSAGDGVKILFDSLESLTLLSGMAGQYNAYRVDQLKMALANAGNMGDSLHYGYHLIPFSGPNRDLAGLWQWLGNTDDDSGHELHGDSLPHTYGLWQNSCPYIELDGMGERVEVVDFAHATEAMSLAFWAKYDHANWITDGAFASKTAGFVFRPDPSVSGKYIEFSVYVNALPQTIGFDLATLPGFELSDWHHYAVTFDAAAGMLNLYVDGLLRSSVTLGAATAGIDYAYSPLWFGAGFGPNSFDGLLGETRYFSTALSDSAVLDLYNLRAACFSPPTALLPQLEGDGLLVYPNPASEQVGLVSESPLERVELYSVVGSLVRKLDGLESPNLLLQVGDLPAGPYVLLCWNATGLHRVKLVLK